MKFFKQRDSIFNEGIDDDILNQAQAILNDSENNYRIMNASTLDDLIANIKQNNEDQNICDSNYNTTITNEIELEKNDRVINKKTGCRNTVNKIHINTDCIGCGTCALLSKYIKENADGSVSPIGSGIVNNEDIVDFEKVIMKCPTQALTLVDGRITNREGIEGIMELRKLLISNYSNYKIPHPDPNQYRFLKEEYKIAAPIGRREWRYDYTSEKNAMSAGLQEFDRIMYSQLKVLVQQVLVQYKAKYIQRYTEYVEEEGNYYFDIKENISTVLHKFIIELNELTNGEACFSKNFNICNEKPNFGLPGNKISREMNVYQLNHLEESWILEHIIREIEPLSWFDVYINTDNIIKYDKNKEKYMYSYDLREAIEVLSSQILNEVEFVLNSYDGMKEIIPSNIKNTTSEMEKEINEKFESILKSIDDYLNKYDHSRKNIDAINSDIPQVKLEEAEKLYLECKLEKAFEIFCTLAKQGNGRAMFFVREYYRFGLAHVKEDMEKAEEWLERGYKKGDILCSLVYTEGFSNNKVSQELFSNVLKLALHGDVIAQSLLAVCYGNGLGTKIDKREMIKWLEISSSAGYWQSDVVLGICYIQGDGVEVNSNQGMNYLMKAAKKGCASAKHILGDLYHNGEGVAVDYEIGRKWLLEAYADGYSNSALYIGALYYDGVGVEKDYEKAKTWFIKAVEKGNIEAKKYLKNLFEIEM